MTALARHHAGLGARLAPDQIPLDYGDQRAELAAALGAAALLDRGHEGRVLLTGRDQLSLVHRMSTNAVADLAQNRGAPTVFTNSNGRILFRVFCARLAEGALLITEAGQGAALADFLRRSIFYGDDARVEDISGATAQFALHGPGADAVVGALSPDLHAVPPYASASLVIDGCELTALRRKPICGSHWTIVCARADSVRAHQTLLEAGAGQGLVPAGSLVYNSLRIRGGRAAGLELSADYIPLEVGLWDEISFSKGCYTGQEIIARMESRGRLAKILVKLSLSAYQAAPCPITAAGRTVGMLTSCALAGDGKVDALAVVRAGSAKPGARLRVGESAVEARVAGYAGVAPPFILAEA